MPEPAERCTYFRTITSLWLDVELPLLESALHTAHLASCLDCREHAGELAEITARLRAAPAQEPGRAVVPVRRPQGRRTRLLAAGAAGLALVVVAVGGRTVPAEQAGGTAGGSAAKAV